MKKISLTVNQRFGINLERNGDLLVARGSQGLRDHHFFEDDRDAHQVLASEALIHVQLVLLGEDE